MRQLARVAPKEQELVQAPRALAPGLVPDSAQRPEPPARQGTVSSLARQAKLEHPVESGALLQ